MVKYVSTYPKGTLKKKKKISKGHAYVAFLFFFSFPLFFFFFYKSICCWYSFELPQLVKAVQMSTDNICFYKEGDKRKWAAI